MIYAYRVRYLVHRKKKASVKIIVITPFGGKEERTGDRQIHTETDGGADGR